MTVLIADDDPIVLDIASRYLERDGHEVLAASDGDQAWELLRNNLVHLVVADIMMPGRDGITLCRDIRSGDVVNPGTPIILLTALGEEEDRVLGLESGADDYVVKPFSPRELALRVAALLRRAPVQPTSTGSNIRDGEVELNVGARTVTVAGVPVNLTGREFDLLHFFLTHQGSVYSRQDLLEQVWNWDFGDYSTVTVHVKRLRAKLKDHHRVRTVWGHGYSWGGSGEED